MTKEAAKTIANYCNGKIDKNYSGRGMFGKTTYGVVIDDESELFYGLAEIMTSGNQEERENVAEWLCNIKSDNMGLQMIYY